MILLNKAPRKTDREYRQEQETGLFGKKLQAWCAHITCAAKSTAFFMCLVLVLSCWCIAFDRETYGNDSGCPAVVIDTEGRSNKIISAPGTGNAGLHKTVERIGAVQAWTKKQGSRRDGYTKLGAGIHNSCRGKRNKEYGQKYLLQTYKRNRAKKRTAEDIFYQKAISYHRHNMLKQAINMYREILNRDPDYRAALFNIASAYITSAAFSKAYPCLRRLNNLDPDNFPVLLNLAITEIGLGKFHEALLHLDMAEKLKNESGFEIFLNRAIALSRLGRTEDALQWYIKAEKIRPDSSPLLFNMAVLYDKSGQYKKALNYYETLMKQDSFTTPHEKEAIEARVRKIKSYLAWLYSQTKTGSYIK